MKDEVLKLHVTGLLFAVALLFTPVIKAVDSIPAVDTGQLSYQVTCTGTGVYGNGTVNTYDANGSFNSWYVPCANGTAKQGSFEVSIYTYLFDKIGAGGQTTLNINGGGTYARFSRTLTSNGSDAGFSTYHSTGNYTVQTSPLYTCPDPNYPNLNGTICEANPDPYCGFDTPVFISQAQTQYSTLCLNMPDGYSSCEYQAVTESTGTINGYTYTPTSESCSCDSLSTTPCANHADSATPDQPDQNNCITTGGMQWCSADPQERCSDQGGYTVCDTNCGYINDVFMCGDYTQPDAQACTSTDTRPECSGLSEGQCPVGFDCSGTNDNTTDNTPCQLNDTRPSCVGQPEGSIPQMDTSNIEALLQQGNVNTAGILDSLNRTDMNPSNNISNQRQANNDISDIADQSEVDSVSTELTGESDFFSTIGASNGYFSSFVTSLLPSTNTTCSPYNMDWSGSTITIDVCTESAYIKTLLAWLLNFVLAWYAFTAFTTRSSPEVK